jgi:Beta-propeller repeat
MRVCCLVALVCLVLLGSRNAFTVVAPDIVYGTFLGGRHKECATAIAVDGAGGAYVVGRTPSGDFPVTAGAFRTRTRVNNDDWTGFVSKISERGDRLLYSSFLGGDFFSSANAITVDSAGRAFVVGSTCSSKLPTTESAVIRKAPGSDKLEVCDGFVVWLNAEGTQMEYGTYLGGRKSDAATAVSLGPGGNVVYIGGYTSSADFPVAGRAPQPRLNGSTNGFLSAIDVQSGKLLYSTYLGGTGNERITGIAVAPDGEIYVAGTTDSKSWPDMTLSRFGELGETDGFVVRIDPTGKLQPIGVRIGGSGEESLAGIDVDSAGHLRSGSNELFEFSSQRCLSPYRR